MATPEVTRLPCEIIDRGEFIEAISLHPETGKRWDIRIIEKATKFGERWAALDGISRMLSNAMQSE